MNAPVIEVGTCGTFAPLEWFCDTPENNCRMGVVDGLLACAWLSLHDDSGADFDHSNRLQIITPLFVNEQDNPVLIHTVDGKLVLASKLRVGQPITVDLLQAHALVPERYAKAIIARQGDDFPRFNRWYKRASLGKKTPTLVWRSQTAGQS